MNVEPSEMITYRKALPQDFASAVECLKDVYDDCYVDNRVFDAAYLRKAQESGLLNVYVAVTADGEVVATHADCEPFYFRGARLFYLFTVKNRNRGNHIAEGIVKKNLEGVQNAGVQALYAQAVTRHCISQKVANKNGFKPTGLLFSLYDKKHAAGLKGIKTEVQTLVVQTMRLGKEDAGILYLPCVLNKAANRCYRDLEVTYSIHNEFVADEIEQNSKLAFFNDDNCGRLYIQVVECGLDLKELISLIANKYRENPMQTRNIYLNIDHPSAIYGYQQLRAMGYIFAGFKPLSAEHEYMILFDAKDVELDFSELHLKESYRQIFNEEIFKEIGYEIKG